ncbi:MAG TPA: class I SAM-dependent methyltransferase [Dehalococcoidia bacterium]|nr:class I SAM-dependent methyltransferase [Dehalococcoidia bacterium]
MTTAHTDATGLDRYAARVDAVLAQRTRLRGPQPKADLFAGLPADHPLLTADPRRPLNANLQILASYVEPDDVIIDVGGGAGRVSLPLGLHCQAVINIDPSAAMGAAFAADAAQAGMTNVRFIESDWLSVDPPTGTVALVNHVTYFIRDIVAFLEKLERLGRRRVLMTVISPPPPSYHRMLYPLVYGEEEVVVPGHVELANVLWELGILPDIRVLPLPPPLPWVAARNREEAIAGAVMAFGYEQWAHWPIEPTLVQRVRAVVQARFEDLFVEGTDGITPRWLTPGHEILLTWQPTG